MKVEASSGLLGEATPPPAVSLIRQAPRRSCSRAEADFVRAVGDHAGAELFHAGERAAGRAGHFVLLAEVAVAAGDSDHGAGRVNPRAGREAFVDGALEAEGGAADVADGGETAEKCVAGFGGGQQVRVTHVVGESFGGSGADKHRKPVGVDQAGHERAAARVDDFGGGVMRSCVAELGGGDGVGGNCLDLVAANEHVLRRREFRGLAVEDADVFEEGDVLGRCRVLGG